jgi:hypothetical protein
VVVTVTPAVTVTSGSLPVVSLVVAVVSGAADPLEGVVEGSGDCCVSDADGEGVGPPAVVVAGASELGSVGGWLVASDLESVVVEVAAATGGVDVVTSEVGPAETP